LECSEDSSDFLEAFQVEEFSEDPLDLRDVLALLSQRCLNSYQLPRYLQTGVIVMNTKRLSTTYVSQKSAFSVPDPGSESVSVGFVCFWASRIRIRICWSQVRIRMQIRLRLQIQILPFSNRSVGQTAIMIAKKLLYKNFLDKNFILIMNHILKLLNLETIKHMKKIDFLHTKSH
jgi:hypothetical protein